ncbi:ganglioside GM2 activator-like isoform X2 [Bacillus rossius redtenbacheri]|uniref:ganglioside GM2 activator-like isoform X2 n=1 Tax=Bacillus rossius redtenbacheri TaxID=93214 RepID=UPI002FDC9F41
MLRAARLVLLLCALGACLGADTTESAITESSAYANDTINETESAITESSAHANDTINEDISARSFHSGSGKARKPQLKSFTFENCGAASDPGKLLDVKLRHIPDGDIVVSVAASTDVVIKAPLKVDIKAHKKILGVWVAIPCFKGLLGSCTITDICHFGMSRCPFKPLVDARIPCNCPVPKGKYGVKDAEFPVPVTTMNDIFAGTYKATVRVTTPDSKQLACYDVNFKIA